MVAATKDIYLVFVAVSTEIGQPAGQAFQWLHRSLGKMKEKNIAKIAGGGGVSKTA